MKYQSLFLPLWAVVLSTSLAAQANPEKVKAALASPTSYANVPLRRLSLFSSGVGFFEHSGTVNGSATVLLPFNKAAVNDALKSLTINDTGSSPQVSYTSEQTLYRTLKSLKIDLSTNPSVPDLLDSLKGAEIEVFAPNPISGRIIGVEQRAELAPASGVLVSVPYLALNTPDGIRTIAIKDIGTFSFKDPQITSDLSRALDLILASHADQSRTLAISLPGTNKRSVTLSYVIPAPVWKVSYRLDLSQNEPLLQGWAIVDNDSDTDWNQVELSLVTGRPVSFIQNLYAPYHTNRPTLPLAIAGIAEAQTYDSAWADMAAGEEGAVEQKTLAQQSRADFGVMRNEAMSTKSAEMEAPRSPAPSLAGGAVTTAQAQATGDMFEFTIKTPVTLARQQSAMLPLVESTVKADKYLVFSGSKAANGATVHPSISAEITNTTGMKLPAGPITVYDGGTYSGDALIDFFPENDKRIISYGDDLSVSGSLTINNSRLITSVTASQGVMIINRKQVYEKKYTFNNVSGTAKRTIIEHPITSSATLTEPSGFDERTAWTYRFVKTLPNGASDFTVKEERPFTERITLGQLSLNSFISYANDGEIPANVRDVLQQAIELRRAVDSTRTTLNDIEVKRTRLVAEQERTRQNINAVGNQSQQGLEYLRRLSAQDAEIDALTLQYDAAQEALKAAQSRYDSYIAQINL
ncbi:MAG: DUF4139 domain-containing protein [Spirochaetaceae bacterium]|jgi:hypothetical protein|nr:DUF4139 domain-containing protein [Spirochaetaceae bacterium]